jgi:hypothetical protein
MRFIGRCPRELALRTKQHDFMHSN